MNKKSGYTLVELLIVIAIIGILVSIGIVSYGSVNKRSRDTKRKSDVEQIRSALEMYRADMGYYSGSGNGSWTDASDLAVDLVDTYAPAIPSDPATGQLYRYMATNGSGTPTRYYGYCISALLESDNPADSCTPDAGSAHNYGTKNP
jgi:prepilin-type N-terminal cleavage/methylation domain-containing protein